MRSRRSTSTTSTGVLDPSELRPQPLRVSRHGFANPRTLRRWFGSTQAELAQILGISRSTVARWEDRTRVAPDPLSVEGRLLVQLISIRDIARRLWAKQPTRARAWLRTAVPALGRRRPIDVLKVEGPLPVLQTVLAEKSEGYL